MPAPNELNWDDLRYFVRAAKAGTLAGAARAAGVEHSTVGRRLSALELSLGVTLFLRGPEGLTLTVLGEELAPLAEAVEGAVLAFGEAVVSRRERVRLAVPSGFTGFFAKGIARLRAERPSLSVEILSGAHPVDLKRGEADLAIRIGPVADEQLVMRKLGDVGWSLYASKAYLARRPVSADPTDLTGHDAIIYDGNLAGLPAAKWIQQHAANATIALRIRETMEMFTAAVAGVGIAVLPCYLADAEPALIRLTPSVLGTRNASLIYRREVRLSEPVRAVIRFVLEVMREHAEQLAGVPTRR
jgi:DNA-binding transcriptional LysR family regulator